MDGRVSLKIICGKFERILPVVILVWITAGMASAFAQANPPTPARTPLFPPASATTHGSNVLCIVEMQGAVDVMLKGETTWSAARTNQILHPFDRLHAGANSRVALRWSDESVAAFGASTELEILPPRNADEEAGLHLIRGIVSFFHRDQPGRIRIITRGAVAGVEGTEFALAVDNADNSTLSVIDGRVRFGNEQGMILLTNGEQAVTAPGKAPLRTSGFIANNLLQWCFYYPAVLDPDELTFTADEQSALADSLAAYRSGDLLAALEKYPPDRRNVSDSERVYHAALLLAVGEVAETEALLADVTAQDTNPHRGALALRQLIAAVKREPSVAAGAPRLASELLANSYFEQSRAIPETSLRNALALAQHAAAAAPKFGFAWARVAELEFSFGRTPEAFRELNQSLDLSPRNAQALALKGFILMANGHPYQARDWFDRSLAVDAALGNAWLGRGLARIHVGDAAGGREDLLIAAALEPRRAELRSYLGKAYTAAGDDTRAAKELNLAKQLDPKDPTAYLYSALLNQRNNEVNDAIRDVEKSQALNNNRSVYRSQLLLDQDSAVRSANLAWMYRDDGLFDLSIREAQRAVSYDYANYSAHLFLANSYNQQRDPDWTNLRYETPAVSEYWIANMLAPASAGWLTDITSEQPYTKLFDQFRVGFASDTTYLSRQAWDDKTAQFGTFDKFSYLVEGSYFNDPGQRPNNYVQNQDLELSVKFQLTPQDSVFLVYDKADIKNGDVNEYYKENAKSAPVRYTDYQNPSLYEGFHHEWSPGVETLVMASYANGPATLYDPSSAQSIRLYNHGKYVAEGPVFDKVLATTNPKEYSAELQQIWETPNHTTVVGARYFWGDINFRNIEWDAGGAGSSYLIGDLGSYAGPNPKHFPYQIANQDITDVFHHESLYAYHDWQILNSLQISAGVSYDYLDQPADVNTLPFSRKETSKAQTSPKAGLIWTPFKNTTFRAAYTRSLSGFINDSGVRLEPTEVAGFNQAYRSIIPDTVAGGDTSGSRLDTVDVSLEQKFDTGTYLALSGEILYSRLMRYDGGYFFDVNNPNPFYFAVTQPLRQFLDYREPSLTFTADQLLGKQWAVGVRYRLSEANLYSSYVDFPAAFAQHHNVDPLFKVRQSMKSTLNTLNLHANWNHPSGLFSILEADWYSQKNMGFTPAEPGDDFWQVNISGGFRFWHRRAEVSVGILNLFDQNYQLQPLNLYNEMATTRTYYVRLLLSF
jgi:Tfp pilus assembly protein PilF